MKKRVAAEDTFLTLDYMTNVLRAPHNYCPGLSDLDGATEHNSKSPGEKSCPAFPLSVPC